MAVGRHGYRLRGERNGRGKVGRLQLGLRSSPEQNERDKNQYKCGCDQPSQALAALSFLFDYRRGLCPALRDPLQLESNIERALKAFVRILRKAGVYDVREGRRRERLGCRNWFGIFFENRAGHADLAFAFERPCTGYHFV